MQTPRDQILYIKINDEPCSRELRISLSSAVFQQISGSRDSKQGIIGVSRFSWWGCTGRGENCPRRLFFGEVESTRPRVLKRTRQETAPTCSKGRSTSTRRMTDSIDADGSIDEGFVGNRSPPSSSQDSSGTDLSFRGIGEFCTCPALVIQIVEPKVSSQWQHPVRTEKRMSTVRFLQSLFQVKLEQPHLVTKTRSFGLKIRHSTASKRNHPPVDLRSTWKLHSAAIPWMEMSG